MECGGIYRTKRLIRRNILVGAAKILLFVAIGTVSTPAMSQKPADGLFQHWFKKYPGQWIADEQKFKPISPDTLAIIETDGLTFLRSKGYLLATVDISAAGVPIVSLGPEFQYGFLSIAEIPDSVRQAVLLPEFPHTKSQTFAEVNGLRSSLITYYVNRGHPFASVSIEAVDISEGKLINGVWRINIGPRVTWGPILLEDSISLRQSKLAAIIDIKQGRPFSQGSFEQIPQMFSNLPFLQLKKQPLLTFESNQAIPSLSLTSKKSNSLDALLSIIPSGRGGGIRLVGQARLDLWNPFGFAANYFLEWESIQPETQRLNIATYWAKVFQLPTDVSIRYQLWKQDSAYLQQEAQLGFTRFARRSKVYQGLDLAYKNTRLLSDSVYWIPNNVAEASQILVAARFQNYLFPIARLWHPYWTYSVYLGVGQRQTGKQKSFLWEIRGRAQAFTTLGKSFGLFGKMSFGFLPRQLISGAEQYRLGGHALLRGFNERQFFTPQYASTALELRLKTAEDSYLALFWDQALMNTIQGDNWKWEFPLGVGLGMQWKIKAGQLRVFWGTGNLEGKERLSLDNSRLHISFQNRF